MEKVPTALEHVQDERLARRAEEKRMALAKEKQVEAKTKTNPKVKRRKPRPRMFVTLDASICPFVAPHTT